MDMSLPLAPATCLAALVAARQVAGASGKVAACLCLAFESALQAAGFLRAPAAASAARLAVAAVSTCPAMSLLGAKRPQHAVWQFIVASLAVVLSLPAVAAVLIRPDGLPDVHLLERAFLLVLALVGWMNFAATRRGPAATLVTAGQLAILRPFLPGLAAADAMPQPALDCVGGWLIATGAVLALARQRHPAPPRSRPADRVDPPYLALRETLGAAWALRVAERFDAVAISRGWPCRLRFDGLEAGGDPADDSWHRDALRAFRSLMHRFVTDDWLARHGHGS
ncbi:MAG: hypothetical protein EBZ59_06345 [Planctomycetia bacterium]|nr:hypothetical protein [Planctomycetia bacterium]